MIIMNLKRKKQKRNIQSEVGKSAGAARRQLQVSQAGRAKLEILKYYIVTRTAGFDNGS